jgi:phage replication initiation protein
MRPLYGQWGGALGLGAPQRGLFGFRSSLPILLNDKVPMGRMDFGGDSQRGWLRVDLPAKGCSYVEDWDALDSVEALPSAEPRRLDLALTTWRGEVGHNKVVKAHADGRFTTRGRPPNLRTIINSDRSGDTCYIGKRDSDKFFRAYDKGAEMALKSAGLTHVDGFPIEDIYRCELELKADATPIPWETVERRDQYFAGAYPFCADILPGIEPDILQRRPERAAERDLQAALTNCRIQYGATLFTALAAYSGDICAVWEKIVGKEHNEALLEAGVLLHEHD